MVLRRPVESAQYTSIDYTQTLDDHRVLASVGSVGDAYDNALAESFVDSFKTELITDRVWVSRSQLELALVEYVGWFNHDRLHQSLGDIPPAEFEALNDPKRLNEDDRSPKGPRSRAAERLSGRRFPGLESSRHLNDTNDGRPPAEPAISRALHPSTGPTAARRRRQPNYASPRDT